GASRDPRGRAARHRDHVQRSAAASGHAARRPCAGSAEVLGLGRGRRRTKFAPGPGADAMSRYAKVDRRIWLDERFRALSDDGRYLWLALLTHPNLTFLGTLRSTWAGLA